MQKLICIIIAILIMSVTANYDCWGQVDHNEIDWGIQPMEYSNVGTVGWQFLKLPTDARSIAMGGVKSSVSYGDANASLTNPASTVDVKNIDLSFSNMKWVANIGYNSFAIVKNMNAWGIFGLNFIYVDYGDEVRTEYHEEVLVTNTIYTPILDGLGTFGAHDLAIGISYARRITDKLNIGGNLRYLEEKIDDAQTSTWSLDIGTIFYTGYKSLRISMLGSHFGPDAEFRNYRNRIQKVPFRMKIPMQLSLGMAFDVLEESLKSEHRLTVACEYNSPNDGSKKFNIGAEYVLMRTFALRSGYRFNYDEEGLTFGGGFNYGVQGVNFHIDYAYIDVGLFSQVHMFSLGIKL